MSLIPDFKWRVSRTLCGENDLEIKSKRESPGYSRGHCVQMLA